MPRYEGYLCDVKGFQLGNAQDLQGGTGVTVVLAPKGCVGGVDVRGGAPGGRETDVLRPENAVDQCHAVVLSGGSAFGLRAFDGVVDYLQEKEIGFDVQIAKIPIVSGAILFDLFVGDNKTYPSREMGYQACLNASFHNKEMGNIGGGSGCSVGKIFGIQRAMKSGLGQASMQLGDLVVSAVVCVNAVGDVVDPNCSNEKIAGLHNGKTRMSTVSEIIKGKALQQLGQNTTLACIATNARLNKSECLKVSQMAHDGYARAIHPVHTLSDGDSIFTLASGELETSTNLVGVLGAEVIARAIVNACIESESAYGLLSYQDFE